MKTVEKLPELTRRISIVLTAVSLLPRYSDVLAVPQNTTAKELNNKQGIYHENTHFKGLGNPSTMLSVRGQPSNPIYIKKGSLVAIFGVEGSALTLIRTKLHLVDPLKSLIYGGSSFMYQRCISTVPFSMLISPKGRTFFENSGQKTFTTLILDGRYDWALLNKSALQAYTGNSLSISKLKKPRHVSKRLSKILQLPRNSRTGLSSWNNLGYTLLSGRGLVGLVGNGSIYTITLKESEEILVNPKLLLALNVNGPNDLENCVAKYKIHLRADYNENEEIPLKINSEKTLNHINILDKLSTSYRIFVGLLLKTKEKLGGRMNGEGNFIKIVGPRTLFLESNFASADINNSLCSSVFQFKSSVNFRKKQRSSDYLNYAIANEQSQTNFRSTPDFDDSLRKKSRH